MVLRSMFRRLALLAPALGALALGACAVSMPVAVTPPPDDDDVTGSITPLAQIEPARPKVFAALDEEDWRRAGAALAIALDPQGNGSTTPWENVVTRRRGSFAAAGPAYPVDDLICRPYSGALAGQDGEARLSGSACRDKRGEWTILDARARGG